MEKTTNGLLEVSSDALEVSQAFYEAGYTDGLPIVPPTPERVKAMLASQLRPAATVIGRLPPRLGAASLESIAVNAVMAGAKPEVFPVIVAALEAMLDPVFNLLGVQATTHPCTPLVVVSGPIRHALHMNGGANAMGEGNMTHATIGRAIRLTLRNVGGAVPGSTDMVTHGTPARAGFVFAENEEDSPFPAFHESLGFAKADSVVSVFASEGPHNINDHSSNTATSLLKMLCGTIATSGSNDLGRGGKPLIVLGPEHADILAREGYTRQSLQKHFFEEARFPLESLPEDMRDWLKKRSDVDATLWNAKGVPVANKPEDIAIMVAGGKGRHSVYIPSFGFTRPAWRKIPFAGVVEGKSFTPACDC